MAELIPVTVLTGFLGAGKTTLLNKLLRRAELAGTAVLVNEFGEIGLDHLLMEKLDDDAILLNAGCLCCTVRGDLVRALRDLRPRIDAGMVHRVVIETTGLADPAPIIQTLMGEPVLATRYRLDGIVTVVDAVHAMRELDEHEEAVRQVAVADRLVLTKTDLGPGEGLTDRLRRLNPGAPMLTANQGDLDPNAILNAGLFDAGGKIADVRKWLDADAFAHHHEDHHHHDGASSHHHHDVNRHDGFRHDTRIETFCLTFDEPLHWQGIGTCLEMLIATRGESLLRVKGILNLVGQERPVAIHGVQHMFHEPVLLPEWPEGDTRQSRIVFITRDLSREIVESGLRAFEDAARE
jgi:G3E family GTPase